VRGIFDTRIVLDIDVVNIAMGIDRFNLQAHQPHPPGYLGYVLLLRVVHSLLGVSIIATTKLVAVAMASLAVVFVFLATQELAGKNTTAARWAAGLCASNPILIYYAIDGQTHAAEAAAAAVLLWLLARRRNRNPQGLWAPLSIGLLLALGAAFRPSFACIAILPVLYSHWRDWPALLAIAVAGALGTLLWFVPTLQLAGGWSAYREASDALLGLMASKSSVLSQHSDARLVTVNIRGTITWGVLATAVAAIAFWFRGTREENRWSFATCALMVGPALLFYGLVYVAEPGYLIGLVPPACIAAGLSLGRHQRAAQTGLVTTLVAAQLAFFFVMPSSGTPGTPWLPTSSEIFYRQFVAEHAVHELTEAVPEEARVLAISDVGPAYLLRQLPLLRKNTEVLVVFSERLSMFNATTLGLASEHDWRPVPGPALLVSGKPSVLTTVSRYDVIAVGPYASDALRQELKSQLSCPWPPASDAGSMIVLSAERCFLHNTITMGPHALHWNAPQNGLAPL